MKIAYFANQFPSTVEPYVMEEIDQLRARGVRVISGSARTPDEREKQRATLESAEGMIVLFPLQLRTALRGSWLCLARRSKLAPLVRRVVFRGSESPLRRVKALAHTWLGACYAASLKESEVEHIHVHHGYFGSWIAMVAAQLLNVDFSMTLHGSDLLLHRAYLDIKLRACTFCLTISEFNRRYILDTYPGIDETKVRVTRLGVDVPTPGLANARSLQTVRRIAGRFSLLAVGRLHAVKNHPLLLRACAQLIARGIDFECVIAGEGPERRHLEALIRKYGLEANVTLLGHVLREQIDSLYARADIVVLTSRSEGIPLVLMEAMARGRVVLAPAITGIPELVISGKTGFLYDPGSLGDLVAGLLYLHSLSPADWREKASPLSAARDLDWVKHGAQSIVRHNFNRRKNLESFADSFLQPAA